MRCSVMWRDVMCDVVAPTGTRSSWVCRKRGSPLHSRSQPAARFVYATACVFGTVCGAGLQHAHRPRRLAADHLSLLERERRACLTVAPRASCVQRAACRAAARSEPLPLTLPSPHYPPQRAKERHIFTFTHDEGACWAPNVIKARPWNDTS
jgi:hypothetical protein